MQKQFKLIAFSCVILIFGCNMKQEYTNRVLTKSNSGHTVHHNNIFSPDGQWIVFDGRNDDTKIGETATIGIVNIHTGQEKTIYHTTNPSLYGPGVGAASFSPTHNRVIFIHGLVNADKTKPYSLSRRTGVGIDLEKPFAPFNYDARDTTPPYTPGSLRGGTHSHCWSGDGKLISFTYNDEQILPDLRTVGVLIPSNKPIIVEDATANNEGIMYAAIIASVEPKAQPGTNEINKAFDECWVGKNGYTNSQGVHIPYAIAFQGNTVNLENEVITEIFIVDIDTNLILADKTAVGTTGQRPQVPKGIVQRRLTFSEKGLSNTRHWLRSSPNGKYIYALAKDDKDINQIIEIEINTGDMNFLTNNKFSIDYTFNLSPNGENIAYIADNKVWLLHLRTKKTEIISNLQSDEKIIGAPSFSPDGKTIAYNAYIQNPGNAAFIQIITINLK